MAQATPTGIRRREAASESARSFHLPIRRRPRAFRHDSVFGTNGHASTAIFLGKPNLVAVFDGNRSSDVLVGNRARPPSRVLLYQTGGQSGGAEFGAGRQPPMIIFRRKLPPSPPRANAACDCISAPAPHQALSLPPLFSGIFVAPLFRTGRYPIPRDDAAAAAA